MTNEEAYANATLDDTIRAWKHFCGCIWMGHKPDFQEWLSDYSYEDKNPPPNARKIFILRQESYESQCDTSVETRMFSSFKAAKREFLDSTTGMRKMETAKLNDYSDEPKDGVWLDFEASCGDWTYSYSIYEAEIED